jgi:DNA end-binding protein Ku
MKKSIPSSLAPSSGRILWKGAISFGLVHIPVTLYSATASSGVDFDWLDKRTMDPVGYKRINKKSGKEIDSGDIVKGVALEDGRYVVLSAAEIAAAYPKTTQTIEIEAFVPAGDIPFVYLERPYYIAPINRGEKVYALLREALTASKRVGVAKVVIQTKQHLAVLIPSGPALVLNLLRWGGEIRSWEELKLPPLSTKAAGLKDAEMAMAKQLIDDMTAEWNADSFRDSFSQEIMRLVDQKAKAGHVEDVEKIEQPGSAPGGAEVIDLTALLRRSLEQGRADGSKTQAAAPATAKKRPPAASSAKAAPVVKRAAKKTSAGSSTKVKPKAVPATKASSSRAKPARKAA